MEFLKELISTWWGILIVVIIALAIWITLSVVLYKPIFKRFYDILLSFTVLAIFSPLLLILTIVGAISMKGNPFFVQKRPGKNAKIFKLLKFRTMNFAKDKNGNLLPDDQRVTKYGNFLRKTSLDELPEFINILIGQMSFVGPRPLLVEYLPWYTEEEKHRHDVRPGLTGLAQVSGRNLVSWDKRFQIDLEYVRKVGFFFDIKICFMTVFSVLKSEGVQLDGQANSEGIMSDIRRAEKEAKEKEAQNG